MKKMRLLKIALLGLLLTGCTVKQVDIVEQKGERDIKWMYDVPGLIEFENRKYKQRIIKGIDFISDKKVLYFAPSEAKETIGEKDLPVVFSDYFKYPEDMDPAMICLPFYSCKDYPVEQVLLGDQTGYLETSITTYVTDEFIETHNIGPAPAEE